MSERPVCTLPQRWYDRLGAENLPVEVAAWSVDVAPSQVAGLDVDRVALVVWPSVAPPPAAGTLSQLPALRAVQATSAGYDHLRGVVPDGVTVCNAAAEQAASTSELCVTLILAAQRQLGRAWEQARQRHWEEFPSASLADRRVVLVGAGNLGRAIAQRLAPFEVSLTRVARTARRDDLGEVLPLEDLPGLVADADLLVLALPSTPQSRHLVDRTLLASMPDDALLVNIGRGSVVDTEALVPELMSGRLRAALDVVDPEPLPRAHPLWDCPGLLLTPHVGGSSSAVDGRTEKLLREQLQRLADGRPLLNRVAL